MTSNYSTTFLKAILAGMMVSMGATLYLIVENHTLGAFLFTFGLYSIYTMDFYLFTGKVGYLLSHRRPDKLLIVWCGNLVGTGTMAFLISQTRLVSVTPMIENVKKYSAMKISDGLLSVFILGIFCGLMMYISSESHFRTRNTANSVGGYITLFLCVMLFLLAGFEHSIANMYYFSLAGAWSMDAAISLVVISLGNAVGGLLIPATTLLMKTDH